MTQESTVVRDFAIIMAVAGGSLLVMRRLGQPVVLGYLLAGIVVGPFLFPDLRVANVTFVRRLADLGLVIILFSIGLEFGWERIRRLGFTVVVIGLVETSLMIALGYQVGRLLGWSGKDAIFLGAALSISSSAVVVKMLHDSGELRGQRGRLIVGILVVEDLVAVLLLTILSGVAANGTANVHQVGNLAGKLALFVGSAVVMSALFAPRIMDLVAKQGSRETLLISALGLCFGLALMAEELSLEAASGAFLIGAVLGDTKHAKPLEGLMTPVRDVFAAIFFVAVGMVVDLKDVGSFLGPAIAVSALFIAGKVLANAAATFLAGLDAETSLEVGTGMAQMGEFSLAIVKVGADQGAIRGAVFPVTAVTTLITSVTYPYVFRSSPRVAASVGPRLPAWLRDWALSVRAMAAAARASPRLPGGAEVRDAFRQMGLNLAVVVVLLTVAPLLLRSVDRIAERVDVSQRLLGLIIGTGVVALSVPSIVAIWRGLRKLTGAIAMQMARLGPDVPATRGREVAAAVVRHSLLIVVTFLLVVWSLPFFNELFKIGGIARPLPLVLIGVALALTAGTVYRIHQLLVSTVTKTFLGDGSSTAEAEGAAVARTKGEATAGHEETTG